MGRLECVKPIVEGASATASAAESAVAGATVLIAEDDRRVRASLERVLRHEGYEVTAVMAEVVAPVVQRARRRSGREITVRVDRGGPLEGRPEALARAVRNLLDNAVKFSESGPVELVIDGGSVTVHDAGPGVPEADRERIFERFHRLDADRDQPGSGLGLAIVRQVAEAHGGTAEVGPPPLGEQL